MERLGKTDSEGFRATATLAVDPEATPAPVGMGGGGRGRGPGGPPGARLEISQPGWSAKSSSSAPSAGACQTATDQAQNSTGQNNNPEPGPVRIAIESPNG